MNTERTEKFVNAIACDLEEGGFRQVSGTTLRRTLTTAVSAALPLLAEQQGAYIGMPVGEKTVARAVASLEQSLTFGQDFRAEDVRIVLAALAATGKRQVGDDLDKIIAQQPEVDQRAIEGRFNELMQQVGEVQGDARARFEAFARQEPRYWNIARSGNGYYYPTTQDAWVVWQAALAARQPGDA